MTTSTMRPGDYEAMLQARLAQVRARPRPIRSQPSRSRAAKPSKPRPRGLIALSVTTLLLVFGAAIAFAVHENTALELDGDSVNQPLVAGTDWDDVYADSLTPPTITTGALAQAFTHDEANPDSTHHEPSNKDEQGAEDWGCVRKTNPTDKADIRHAFAAAFDIGGALHVFFGANRDTNNGSMNIATWLFQNPVTCQVGPAPTFANGSFTGHKTDGDLFIVSEFTNGGAISLVNVYIWTDPTPLLPESGDECLGDGVDCSTAHEGQDHAFVVGIDCALTDPHVDPGNPNVCATLNGDADGDKEASDAIDVAWEDDANDPAAVEFFEGGINLSSLFPAGLSCFTGMMVETRSSFEFSSNLHDLAFLDLDTCGSITVEKETNPDGSAADFDFDLSPDPNAEGTQTLSDGESFTWDSLNGGAYTLTESNLPAGWNLDGIVCDDDDAEVIDLNAGTVGLTLDASEHITCTFTNEQDGRIEIEKQTLPDADTTDFTFTGDVAGTLSDGETAGADVAAGSYSSTETVPAGWTLTDITCDDTDSTGDTDTGVASFVVAAGETVRCVFTNTQDGTVEVVKTVSGGLPNGQTFDFELRTGASLTEVGVTVASTTTDPVTGEADFGGATFAPGTYQFCEVNMLPGWHSTLSDDLNAFVPNSDDPGVDNSVVCVEFILDPGETVTFTIDNTPPPGGDARTIGFWKNWTSCDGHGNQDPILDDTLASFVGGGILVGDIFVDTCAEAVAILDKSSLDGTKRASDAAYGLAAQLLAAQLNYQAGAIQCQDATDAIADGQALLDLINFDATGSYLGPKVKGANAVQRQEALALAATLDAYNNNLLC